MSDAFMTKMRVARLRREAERAEALALLNEDERAELRSLFLDEAEERRSHETLRRENAFIARLAERYGGLTAQRVRGALWERVAEEKRRRAEDEIERERGTAGFDGVGGAAFAAGSGVGKAFSYSKRGAAE